jgi:hypothetical protein
MTSVDTISAPGERIIIMKQVWTVALLAGLMAIPAASQAQEAPADPLTAALKRAWDGIALNMKEAADKAPEDKYGFKPSQDVRDFGQEIGHDANAQYLFCSRAKGEPNPNKENYEDGKRSKADLVKALAAATAYCNALFSGATDKTLLEMVGQGPQAQPRAAVIAANIAHSNETYGTIVPYMRMNGIIPPSTARALERQKQQQQQQRQ